MKGVYVKENNTRRGLKSEILIVVLERKLFTLRRDT